MIMYTEAGNMYMGLKCGNHVVDCPWLFRTQAWFRDAGPENLNFKFHDFPGSVVTTHYGHTSVCLCHIWTHTHTHTQFLFNRLIFHELFHVRLIKIINFLELLPAGLLLAGSLFCRQTSSINPLKNACHMCTTYSIRYPFESTQNSAAKNRTKEFQKNPMQTNHEKYKKVTNIQLYTVLHNNWHKPHQST